MMAMGNTNRYIDAESNAEALRKLNKKSCWEELIIHPENRYKYEFDNFIAMIIIVDLIYTTFKYFF